MAKCNFCERKSIFLRVNSEGYCKECVPRVEARRREAEEKRRIEEERQIAQKKAEEERRRRDEELRRLTDEYGNHIGPYFTLCETSVAGVTYKNGRRSRQTILRQIFWKDEPYQRVNKSKCIDLVATTFEGEPAVEVWVHHKQSREQIGYIPKELSAFFHENLYRLDMCEDFEVYGGGVGSDGERHNFGCKFVAKFVNKIGQGDMDSNLYDSFLYKKQLQSSTDNKDINYKLFKAFSKLYPHAWLIGCTPLPDNGVGLVMYVSNNCPIYVKYDIDTHSAVIEFSDKSRAPEFVKV